MSHGSSFIISDRKDGEHKNISADVYYAAAVQRAVSKGIAADTSATNLRSVAPCT